MSGADRVRLREPFTQAAEPYDHVRPATRPALVAARRRETRRRRRKRPSAGERGG